MDVLHIERLLYYRRHSLCDLELHEWSDWRAMGGSVGWGGGPDTHWLFSGTTLCAYTVSPYIYLYLVCNYAWQQKSRTLWLHTTHQMTALLPNMFHFIRTKLASYTTCSSVFQLIMYANIKISKKYYCIYFFTSLPLSAKKKEDKLRVKNFL